MIAAPQSQDTRPSAMEALPTGPSKASMMIAAYRAARLNQRLTLRSTPPAQQDPRPPAAPDREAERPQSGLPSDIATIRDGKGTDQIAASVNEPDAAPLTMTMAEQAPEAASAHPETATIGQETSGLAELISGPAPTCEEPALEQGDIALAQPSCSGSSADRVIQTSGHHALERSQSEWKTTPSWPGSTGPSLSARGMVEPVPAAWDGPVEPGRDDSSHVGTASASFDRVIQTSGDSASGHHALAEIGLGPCMLLRLNQIGIKSIHDVAQVKPDDLRAALGSSSRLLNVEAWINTARHLTVTGCAA